VVRKREAPEATEAFKIKIKIKFRR